MMLQARCHDNPGPAGCAMSAAKPALVDGVDRAGVVITRRAIPEPAQAMVWPRLGRHFEGAPGRSQSPWSPAGPVGDAAPADLLEKVAGAGLIADPLPALPRACCGRAPDPYSDPDSPSSPASHDTGRDRIAGGRQGAGMLAEQSCGGQRPGTVR